MSIQSHQHFSLCDSDENKVHHSLTTMCPFFLIGTVLAAREVFDRICHRASWCGSVATINDWMLQDNFSFHTLSTSKKRMNWCAHSLWRVRFLQRPSHCKYNIGPTWCALLVVVWRAGWGKPAQNPLVAPRAVQNCDFKKTADDCNMFWRQSASSKFQEAQSFSEHPFRSCFLQQLKKNV